MPGQEVNIAEYVLMYNNRQGSEYAKVLTISHTIQSAR